MTIRLQDVQPGDRVHLFIHNGTNMDGSLDYKCVSGRAVIVNSMLDPMDTTVVVNIGGRNGTPAVATAANFVKATAWPFRRSS